MAASYFDDAKLRDQIKKLSELKDGKKLVSKALQKTGEVMAEISKAHTPVGMESEAEAWGDEPSHIHMRDLIQVTPIKRPSPGTFGKHVGIRRVPGVRWHASFLHFGFTHNRIHKKIPGTHFQDAGFAAGVSSANATFTTEINAAFEKGVK